MNEIDLDTLLKSKIYYYLHSIGYLPRRSPLFERLKRNLLIDSIPTNISEDFFKTNSKSLDINFLAYCYICLREELISGTKQIQNLILNSMKMLAKMGNTDACYIISQFYHNITLNIYYNVDEITPYKDLQKLLTQKNPGYYSKQINTSNYYLRNGIDKQDLSKSNPNLIWYVRQNKTLKDPQALEIAAGFDNIKNDILYTGNPNAEYCLAQTIKDKELKNRLIVSASRANFLFENPEFNIGIEAAQWSLYNKLKVKKSFDKYGVKANERNLDILLWTAARIDQIVNFDIQGIYTGNKKALQEYYTKINKSSCNKKYKKEKKYIQRFIEKQNFKIR